MSTGRRTCGALTAAVLALWWPLTTVTAATAVPPQADQPAPVRRCRITDDRLVELSGLASSGDSWFAVTDGGDSLTVFVVDPRDCSVRDVITSPIDPYDVEDVEIDDRGRLWLADTGDNSVRRATVAIHLVTRTQGTRLYRLRYPDGPHDAETMLLSPDGVPYIITKEPFGAAAVYRPTEPIVAGTTVALDRVGSVSVPVTDTPGGPLPGSLGSVAFTGGAVSHDGSVVALRTYTDAYLYRIPSPGEPVTAASRLMAGLRRSPMRIALPHQPQGEAIAFEPDGTLLAASEGQEPVRAVPQAVAEFKATVNRAESMPPREQSPGVFGDRSVRADSEATRGLFASGTLMTVGVLAGVVIAVGASLGRRRRRRSR